MESKKYPILAEFLAAWFHQDFDIEGESVADVVNSYAKVASSHERSALRADIEAFMADHAPELDTAFDREFKPDVIPSVLSGSTLAFLHTIRAGL